MRSVPVDYFCTPRALAVKMAFAVKTLRPDCIADFAAGDGMLLRIAQKRWPNCRVAAIDIRRDAVSELKRKHSGWDVGRCDFLSTASRGRSQLLRGLRGSVDVILLNPPFSARGNSYWRAYGGSDAFRCSRAMAFLLTSLAYLAPKGVAVAVLPKGCMTCQKDAKAWEWILRHYRMRIVDTNGRTTFPTCNATTVIVHLVPRRTPRPVERSLGAQPESRERVSVWRGSVQMHSARGNGSLARCPLVHTTDLRGFSLGSIKRGSPLTARALRGPAVLVPRVGRPDPRKIALALEELPFVLSDCVFAVCCRSKSQARRVRKAVVDRWPDFEALYGGTCAPYVTLASLRSFLTTVGFSIQADRG